MREDDQRRGRLRFGVFELDLRAGELRKHGLRLRLQEQPFQVLAMLLENHGEVVTREELQKKLWPADTFVDFDHGLNKAINKIRDALGDSAESALRALGERVPDVILTSALLSPRDEAVVAGWLRALDAAAAHVQTLTIPVFASGGVAFICARSRARRIHAMETPSE